MSAAKRIRQGHRIVRYEHGGKSKIGVELGDGGDLVDLRAVDPSLPEEMWQFMRLGADALKTVDQLLPDGMAHVPRSEVRLQAPLDHPEKIICIGMNYADHCLEQDVPIPEEPVIFSKFPSALQDPDKPIYLENTEELDFEVELGVVILKSGRNINESDAMDHVMGYTVAHDVSARDWQLRKNGGQWLLGKTFDTFCPLGPCIVTKEAIEDPHNLGIRCRVNGVTVQESNTKQLVHKIPYLISYISRFMTLNSGDLILTGTPPGVGCFRKPPMWLKDGDVVECEIDHIGCIQNIVKKRLPHEN
jgi:2-keto-4-pentenoate hydratase/2-oxohepta-3-ene-1,7-dioic acid hydratase in catechol pathway